LILATKSTMSRLTKPSLAALATTLIIISGLALLGSVANELFNFRLEDYTRMEAHLAAAFMLLGIALLTLVRSKSKFNGSLDIFITSGFVMGIAVLLTTGIGAYHFTAQLQKNTRIVAHTQKTLEVLSKFIGDIAILESEQNSYILMKDEGLLDKIVSDKAEIKKNNTRLYTLIAGDLHQDSYLNRLNLLITKRINWGDEVLKENRLSNAQKIITIHNGIALSQEINSLLFEMANFLIKQSEKQTNALSIQTFLLLPLGVFVSLTILLLGLFIIITGTNEKKQLEQQLHQSQKMEAIGQLTGGVAHDFNNLLGIILGNIDLLQPLVAGNEAAAQRVNTLLKAAIRGADLTKQLLAFSMLQQLNPVPTSLNGAIKNTIEMAERVIGPEIKIITHLDNSAPFVLVDSSGLENVLLNLAINARDAMPSGGSLTISTELKMLENNDPSVKAGEIKPGHYACITVSDTGQGMSSKTMGRVFEPFFTTKPRGKGTGLGLAMVYGFIKQSGGIIKIHSELAHGTSMSLHLPLAEKPPLPVCHDTPVLEEQVKASGIVLVVDDEVDLLEIAVSYLREMGFQVFSATDVISALAVVEQEPNIDLLITDVVMPGSMNGVELAKKIRQHKQDIIVMYSSGFPNETLSERSGVKIDGPLIAKPYQRVEFVAAVREVMKNHPGR